MGARGFLLAGAIGLLAIQQLAAIGAGWYRPGGTDVAVVDGGTGSSTAGAARSALGLDTMATQAANSVAITGGTVAGITSHDLTGTHSIKTVSTITASTSQSQGNGALTAHLNEVSIVANDLDTVTLPAAAIGNEVIVINNGANRLQVFPANSDDAGNGVDSAVVLAVGAHLNLHSFNATTWHRGAAPLSRSYSFTSQGVGSGTFYVAGFYEAPTTEAILNQGALTQTLGASNVPYAAHVFFVCKQNGAATGGASGVATVTVTGTSITDLGVRNDSGTEELVSDNTDCATNEYQETALKWIGQVTLTIAQTGDRTAYDLSGNYGFAKYEDFNNSRFTVNGIEAVGLAGAADAGFDIELLHHSSTGWTYAASGFVPGGTSIVKFSTVHGAESDLDNGVPFAFKRIGLGTVVSGNNSDGIIVVLTTGSANTLQSLSVHITASRQ